MPSDSRIASSSSPDVEKEQRQLGLEFEWILRQEVRRVLQQVRQILDECAKRFRLKGRGGACGQLVKPEKFVLKGVVGGENIKCVATLLGDVIYEADVSLSLKTGSRTHHYKTRVNPQSPWRLNQIQDSGNLLAQAITLLEHRRPLLQDPEKAAAAAAAEEAIPYPDCGEEVVSLLTDLISAIQSGQASLLKPKRRTLEELKTTPNLQSLEPALPTEAVLSFYVQSSSLILTAYQLQPSGAVSSSTSSKGAESGGVLQRFQAESPVAWLHEVLMLFSIALQLCQQLKDKILVLQRCFLETE